jgi:sortase (surface protein transpeptidase)
VTGYALRSDGAAPVTPAQPFDVRTAEPAISPTATVPGAPTATPPPRPFDGAVARMIAPSIGLNHAVESIGVTNGQLDVPVDGVNKVGWYEPYAKPGFGKNAVFAAHVNFNKKNGPFAHLQEIENGAEISIVMAGGPTYVYKVVFYNRYEEASFPTGELIDAPTKPDSEEWITLITCGGTFVPDPGSEFGHYLQRDVVIARRVQ